MIIPTNILQILLYFLLILIFILQVYNIFSIYYNTNHSQYHCYYHDKERNNDKDITFPQIEMILDNDDDEEDEDEGNNDDYHSEEGKKNNVENEYFSECYDNSNDDCVALKYPIYDKQTYRKLIEPTLKQKYLLPNSDKIPKKGMKKIGYCGFGKLLYDNKTKDWSCQCFTPDYFGGDLCDEIGKKLIKENNCTQVASASDILNTDISTFNPFIDGICSRCVSPDNQAPVVNASIPLCKNIVNTTDDDDTLNDDKKVILDKMNPCKYDALNPHLYSSPNNLYIPGYGCVCDYHNGFVEAALESSGRNKNKEISNACIKIGKDKPSSFHRTDVAYYTLNNNSKPIQIHSYKDLEYPFNVIFPNVRELLVKQRIANKCDNYDWLNRVIKPKRGHPIRRINYPKSKWPIVNKHAMVNYYSKRDTTYPISAYRLATGLGMETKHWYELTNDRFMANAVIGRPIVYTYYINKNKPIPWTGKVTLNPLGAVYRKYYGATLMTKPGEIVRMDTRGYESEKLFNDTTNNTTKAITIPPDYKKEMMDESTIYYVPALYITYKIKN